MSIEMNNGALRIQQIIAQATEEANLINVEKDLPYEVDMGNLAVNDYNSLEETKLKSNTQREVYLTSIARDSIQSLVNDAFRLERKIIDDIPFAILPKPLTVLPREKPVPKPKPPTKWELYAKEKGIVKRKKERKLWDEVAQDFVPRYGKLKVQIEKDKNWVMEVPRQANPYEDQFAKAAAAKKERIAKNEFQRLRNIARTGKSETPGVGVIRTDTRDASQLKKAMHFSRLSTASLGKFQPTLKDEKEIRGFNKNVKQERDLPFTGDVKDEKKKALKIIERIKKPHVNTESTIIKEIEKKMVMDEITEKKYINKTGRRSKMGGRRQKKSGMALANLTEGKVGDKKSKKLYAAAQASADTGGKKKRGKKKALVGGKNKSAFGGSRGMKAVNAAMKSTAGKKKNRR